MNCALCNTDFQPVDVWGNTRRYDVCWSCWEQQPPCAECGTSTADHGDPEACDTCRQRLEEDVFGPGWLGVLHIAPGAPEHLKYTAARTGAHTIIIQL